jgi:hypothetical protein
MPPFIATSRSAAVAALAIQLIGAELAIDVNALATPPLARRRLSRPVSS